MARKKPKMDQGVPGGAALVSQPPCFSPCDVSVLVSFVENVVTVTFISYAHVGCVGIAHVLRMN